MTLPSLGLWTLGLGGWLTYLYVTARYLVISLERREAQPFFIHFDWHAYAAGAGHLAERSLYRVPLELGNVPLPLDTFNLPPLAALEAALLLPMGLIPAGVAWQVIGAVGVAAAAVAASRAAGLAWRPALLFGGVVLGAYMAVDHFLLGDEISYWWGLVLGTNNYLVLGVLAAFVVAYAARAHRAAGLLLALAVATKLWPATIFVLLVRDRRWQSLQWAVGALVVQALVWLAWLGPDVIEPMLRSLAQSDQEPSGVIGLVALRQFIDWWPTWSGWIVAAILLLIPARGMAGIGISILAGLAIITNLWGHYLPTVLFAVALVLVDQRVSSRLRGWLGMPKPVPAAP